MTRKELYDFVNALYPVYWPSQKSGECKTPYIVMKYKDQKLSVSNSKAGWQYIDFMVYVPVNSILPLDEIIDNLIIVIGNVLEFTGNITPDFIDTDIKAIMRSIEFRVPKIIK